ncbi:MAG: ATP-binding protein, partial [Pseudomonadota bacterium]
GQAIWDDVRRPTRMCGTVMDIHDLRQARLRAEEANIAKSSFLAAMSHEIRTPLNGVLGMADVLSRTDLSDRQAGMVGTIVESGNNLLQILNDILDISKIEAGKLVLEDHDFDLEEIVSGAHQLFSPHAREKNLAFSVEIEPAAEGHYLGDPIRLRQILFNLISNALKFTERGSVEVTIKRLPADDQGPVPAPEGVSGETPCPVIRFCVRDTGIGIEADALRRIFKAFEQADGSTTRAFGGTGLGLSICEQLAQMMGGRIAAESTPGAGSTFFFDVPLRPYRGLDGSMRPAGAARDGGTHDAAGIAGVQRILVAEDNDVNQAIIEAMLEPTGVDVVIAPDGEAALEAWESQPFDLILMDNRMPKMDGLRATQLIREREIERAIPRTPIIALTANVMADYVHAYHEAGMDGVLAKPVSLKTLFDAIEGLRDDAPSEAGKARRAG